MKLKRKKERKLQKGITLIALVITIIVLLILAGVSTATLTGDNGILTKAQTAKEETQKASEEEQIKLAAMNAAMNTERYNYKVEDGTVPIPAGFAPTQIEGQNSIKDGVVVVDEKGNEFVWIPCIATDNEQESTEVTTEEYINYNQKRNPNWAKDSYEKTNATWTDTQTSETAIPSIQKYKGFYVGRYEAGIPKEADFYPNEENNYKYYTGTAGEDGITKDTTKYVPVSQKNYPAWSFITQSHAKTVSENMIKNNDIQSYLIDSKAWDTICRVIEQKTDKSITSSSSWGNYVDNQTMQNKQLYSLYAIHTNNKNYSPVPSENYVKGYVTVKPEGGQNGKVVELSTGSSEEFKAYNIYDFAGNMWEMTTEICSDSSFTIRGIGFHNAGTGGVTKTVSMGGTYCYEGFRVVLYLE